MTLTKKIRSAARNQKKVSVNESDTSVGFLFDGSSSSKLVAGENIDLSLRNDGYDGYSVVISATGGGSAFAIYTFNTSSSTLLEVGDTLLNPAFTMSYSSTPTSATLYDGTNTVTLTTPFTSGTLTESYQKVIDGSTMTATLSAIKGNTATSNKVFTWGTKVFWGVSTIPADYDEAFIEGLISSGGSSVKTSRNTVFSVTANTGQYIYYCFKTSYGTPTFTVPPGGGFPGGFGDDPVATNISVVNDYSVTDYYDIWRSDFPSLGPTTVGVS